MSEILANFYIVHLYAILLCVAIFIVLVLRKCNVSSVPEISSRLVESYFLFVSFAWLMVIFRDTGYIDFPFYLSAIAYIISSLLLLFAFIAKLRNRKNFLVVSLIVLPVIVFDVAFQKIQYVFVTHTAFGILAYTYLLLHTIKKQNEIKNYGFAFISAGALIVVAGHFIQLYLLFIFQSIEHAYGVALIGSGITYILAGLGYLTILLFDQQKNLVGYAMFDALTGLLNRRGLDYQLVQVLPVISRHNRALSIIAIDIDYFKKVNDSFGHDTGDLILKFIAQQIADNFRESDICCRYGGEEFVVVLPECGEEQAIITAERLRKNIEAISQIYNSSEIKVTVSQGVATDRGEIDIDFLLKRADKALYKAKETGRNRVCVAKTN